MFGVFIFSSTFITKSSDEILKTQDVILGINLPSYLRSLADPIMYITNNLMNFSNFLNVHSPYSFGMEQISGLMHDLGLDFLVRNSVNANSMLWSSNLQFSWLTTGTYLKTFYLDFGYIGYGTQVPVLITNTPMYAGIEVLAKEKVDYQDDLLKLKL